jgi:UDP-N-acetylmuramoyl-L-alanyl-D-glutamate--2,6-diaminopimelate ligase
MGRTARDLADAIVVTSDNPRSEEPDEIIEEILTGSGRGPGVVVEPDRRAAIRAAILDAADGDVVVIAGKGHEQGQTFADRTVPFSDVEEARDALRRLPERAPA